MNSWNLSDGLTIFLANLRLKITEKICFSPYEKPLGNNRNSFIKFGNKKPLPYRAKVFCCVLYFRRAYLAKRIRIMRFASSNESLDII